MGERRITQDALCRATGLSRQTVNDWYWDRPARIELATLDRLCAYFKVGPGELLEWRGCAKNCASASCQGRCKFGSSPALVTPARRGYAERSRGTRTNTMALALGEDEA